MKEDERKFFDELYKITHAEYRKGFIVGAVVGAVVTTIVFTIFIL